MTDADREMLARLEREIFEDRDRTHDSADRLYEMDIDSREAINKLWADHTARVAPLQAQRESIIKALATVESFKATQPVILAR